VKLLTASVIENLPWPLRTLLGCAIAVLSVGITYAIHPLHAFPLLLAFPTVVLCAWFLGMAGSFGCALVDVVLIDALMTRYELRFSTGFVSETARLAVFIVLSTLLGEMIRRFADQKAELKSQQLKRSLLLAQTQRQMAEERARAGEALRQRDEQLQIALRASGLGLWAWEIDEDKVFRSDELYRIVGRKPGSLGPDPEAWLEVVHPEDRHLLERKMENSRENGGDYSFHYRIVRPDGSIRWLESQGRCQFDGAGHLTRIVGVVADVTLRRRAEEAMLRAEKLAVAGRLAASVAHEINNPLEAVANLLYLITLSSTADEAHVHARSALDELLRVSMITQSTLKFHRQAGTPKITHLSEVLEGVLAMFRARLKAAGIVLDLNVAGERAIACMPSEAQQVFANLLSNAIEAMSRGGRLRIRLRPSRDWRDGATEGMRVTIGDTGTGMDRATQQLSFEPFFTTKPETGTGLGMWVVAQLVERHGGDVRLWSSTHTGSSGTVVSMFLPMEPTGLEDAEREAGKGALAEFDPLVRR
jgi:PAS domain S-box-containing protein